MSQMTLTECIYLVDKLMGKVLTLLRDHCRSKRFHAKKMYRNYDTYLSPNQYDSGFHPLLVTDTENNKQQSLSSHLMNEHGREDDESSSNPRSTLCVFIVVVVVRMVAFSRSCTVF